MKVRKPRDCTSDMTTVWAVNSETVFTVCPFEKVAVSTRECVGLPFLRVVIRGTRGNSGDRNTLNPASRGFADNVSDRLRCY